MVMNSGDEARYWYAKGREDGRAERSRLLAAARAVVDALNREPVIMDWIAASKEATRALSALSSAVEAMEQANGR